MQATQEISYIGPRNVRPFKPSDISDPRAFAHIGLHYGMDKLEAMAEAYGMDALQATITTASIPTPVQFLQQWLPGHVGVMTAARKIDELVGVTTIGSFEDEEIVQMVLENTGNVQPYGDLTNPPLASWNPNFERRTIVRFESGMRVGMMEEARSAKIKVDSAAVKRNGISNAMEINRNLIGFNGYNDGANRTYGFLNDPALPAYVSVPPGASGNTQWTHKSVEEITQDILVMANQLQTQSQDNIDPAKVNTTLAIPTNRAQYFKTTTGFGFTVAKWLAENFPKMRVVSAPQFNGANGGENVISLYAESVEDGSSTDGGRVFEQYVPAKFFLVGTQKLTKGMEEAYAQAMAGVMLKRPYGVVRYSGI